MVGYSLRWYQEDAVSATWRHLCAENTNPVIVLPTGAGKSLVIAQLCRDAVEQYRGRVIVLAHRKELLRQNAEKIQALLPDASIGIYSAGLKSRETQADIVVAGIQSCYQQALSFDRRHLVLIDEVHLVPSGGYGMYRQFLADMMAANPKLRCVGLTATPYRMDDGDICGRESLFAKVCYSAEIQRLIADGFLCRLTSKPADGSFDTTGLHKRGGEFILAEQESLFGDWQLVRSACEEITARTRSRRAVLVFCSGVAHAEKVAECLAQLTGEHVGLVTGESTPLEREATLTGFASGATRICVNVDVLTTGFDCPRIDAIAILRATASPGLFAQICGRGFRLHADKQDCLVLDFGGNIERHGPIDAIDFEKRARAGIPGDAPAKQCPACEQLVALGSAECSCGFLFPVRSRPSHEASADTSREILSAPETWTVISVSAAVHQKRNAPEGSPCTLRMDYVCQPLGADGNLSEERISEWICVEHSGFARDKAWKWWSKRSIAPMPNTASEAFDLWRQGAIASPRTIVTQQDGKFRRIIKAELDEVPASYGSVDEWDEVPF